MIRFLRESQSWWKSNTLSTVHQHLGILRLTVLFALILASCKRPEQELGLNLQPEDGVLSILQTDTVTLVVSTVREDSLRSDELSLSLLGNYIDPEIGQTRAGFYSQVRLSSPDIDFGTNAVADSLTLSLVHTGTVYGTVYPQYFVLKELNETIDADSAYYSNRTFATFDENLIVNEDRYTKFNTVDYIQILGDSLPPQLRFHLSQDLANRFITAGAEVYDSNTNWLEFFKGFHLYSNTAEGGIASLDLLSGESKMTLYYHNDTDTLSYVYTINSLAARVNNFAHNFMGPLSVLETGGEYPGDQIAYVQAGASVKTRVEFPFLDDFKEIEGRTINKAQLVIPVAGTATRFTRQSLLYLLTVNGEGVAATLPGQTSTSIDIGGAFDALNGEYRFNITRYVQEYLNGTVPSNFVNIVSGNASVSVTRAILNGPHANDTDPTENMRLIITYSY